jgi:NaMN:DMB phosphoribosyltransferase
MVRNFARGGAAVNVLARASGLELEVVDVGVAAELGDLAGIVHARVRRGTRNLAIEPAMTVARRRRRWRPGARRRGARRRAACARWGWGRWGSATRPRRPRFSPLLRALPPS